MFDYHHDERGDKKQVGQHREDYRQNRYIAR
jgi:hypothetical protein